ncbi:TetR family transcriptional regulator [Salmonella enterica]|nr:TetR family transcriptional regulator [Salmonella enterica]
MYLKVDDDDTLKKKLLLCAVNEFAEYGYEGARVDNIVKAAGCSKQTVYHHYGNKENLFIAVLEFSWSDIRTKEASLTFEDNKPLENIEKIIDFTWNYYTQNLWFLKIVNSENQSKGTHLKKSELIEKINRPHINIMKNIIENGQRLKLIREGIDPVHLNINIAALGFFYLINQHTLSLVYKRQMTSTEALEDRHHVIKDTIMRWIREFR